MEASHTFQQILYKEAASNESLQKGFDKFIKWWTEKGSGMRKEDIDILNINYKDAVFQTEK